MAVQHVDLFRPLADLEIGELRIGLRHAGLGLGDGDQSRRCFPA